MRLGVGVCIVLLAAGMACVHADDKPRDMPSDAGKEVQAPSAEAPPAARRLGRLTQPWNKLSGLSEEQRTKIREIHAAAIAEIACLETIVSREQIDTTLVATEANKELKPGDIKTLQVGARQDGVRLVEMGYAYPGLIMLKQVRHDHTIYQSDAKGVGRALPGGRQVR